MWCTHWIWIIIFFHYIKVVICFSKEISTNKKLLLRFNNIYTITILNQLSSRYFSVCRNRHILKLYVQHLHLYCEFIRNIKKVLNLKFKKRHTGGKDLNLGVPRNLPRADHL